MPPTSLCHVKTILKRKMETKNGNEKWKRKMETKNGNEKWKRKMETKNGKLKEVEMGFFTKKSKWVLNVVRFQYIPLET